MKLGKKACCCFKTDLLYSFVCASVLELGMLQIIVYIVMFKIVQEDKR